jgi:hypothetical protein
MMPPGTNPPRVIINIESNEPRICGSSSPINLSTSVHVNTSWRMLFLHGGCAAIALVGAMAGVIIPQREA